MSRIGNKAVEIPDKVKVNIGNDGAVAVEGPKGKLQLDVAARNQGQCRRTTSFVRPRCGDAQRQSAARSVAQPRAQHGQGVSEGFTKDLKIKASASKRRCRVRF